MKNAKNIRFAAIQAGVTAGVIAGLCLVVAAALGSKLSAGAALLATLAGVLGAGAVGLTYLLLTRTILRRAVMDGAAAVEMSRKLRKAEDGDLLEAWSDVTLLINGVPKTLRMSAVYDGLVGALAEADRMSRQLNQISGEILEQASKLTHGAERQSAAVAAGASSVGQIDRSLRKVVGGVEDLAELGDNVSAATYQMIASIEQVGGNARRLSQAVQEAASATEEMVGNIHGVSSSAKALADGAGESRQSLEQIESATRAIRDRAEQAAQLSSAAREGAAQAKDALSKTVAGVRALADNIESTHEVMRQLGVHSRSIGEILNVISSVASDTHLLSLNASIMAAKAGEHGRGFSVVAQEIKTLAQRTSESAKEIERLILDTQAAVEKAMAAIEEGKSQVGRNMKLSEQADLALAEVLERVDVSARNAREIASATESQTEKNAQLVKAFDEVANRATQIRSAMREQEESSGYVRERALGNQDLVAQVDHAMVEQANSSRLISTSMESLTGAIQSIRLAAEEQAASSAGIVKSIHDIRKMADLVAISAQNVANTSMSALHHSILLRHELHHISLPARGPTCVIGILLDNLREERWRRERKLFEERATELGARAEIRVAEGDPQKQLEQGAELIKLGVDLLLIVAVDSEAAATIVRKAKDAKIPVIAYDRLIKSPDLDLFISFDAVSTGRMQADTVLQGLTGPNVLVLAGSPTDMNAHFLYQGQMEVLKPRAARGEIKIVDEIWVPDWSPEEAYRLTRQAIEKKGPVDAVVAPNDGVAGGAIKAVREFILDRHVIVTGMDTELAACKRLLDGSQAMTVYMPIKLQASRSIEAALLIIRREEIPGVTDHIPNQGTRTPSILLKPIKVDADNLEEVVVKDGYHTLEQIKR